MAAKTRSLQGTGGNWRYALTVLLCTQAVLAIQLAAREPSAPLWQPLLIATGLLALALTAGWGISRASRGSTREQWNASSVVAIALAGLVPLLFEPIARRSGLAGHAPEILLLLCLRNLGLAALACTHIQSAQRVSALVAASLVVFSAALAKEGFIWGLATAAIVTACLWLALSSWEPHDKSRSTQTAAGKYPWVPVGATLVLVTAVFGVTFRAVGHDTVALRGFLPGSGGTGQWSRDSRGGIHAEGDAEVGAKRDAFSVGFVDSDVFIESQQVSLYDTFSDVYGNPIPPKERQRKVVVPFKNFIERHHEPSENQRADAQFSIKRTPPSKAEQGSSRMADALLYVKGRTPLHLRSTAYDRFDGVYWRSAPPAENRHSFSSEDGHWMEAIGSNSAPFWGGCEEHEIKMGQLRTNRLLATGHLERFRIGKVDRPDFFKLAHDGILSLDAPRFPPGTSIVMQTRQANPAHLTSFSWRNYFDIAVPYLTTTERENLSLPEKRHLHPQVALLAKSWVKDVPRGWSQVEAVVKRLRTHYKHDEKATIPDCDDPVGHFLFTTKRGPDYLFASSTAMLLRTLGYPTRLVSGYYARSEKYDAKTGHTPVQSSDTHFWAEVLIERTVTNPHDRAWIIIEPTPGYEVAPPCLTFGEKFGAAISAALTRLKNNALPLMALIASVLLICRFRIALADGAATWWWRIYWVRRARRAPREFLLATVALLDARSRRAGYNRAPGVTPMRHFSPLLATGQGQQCAALWNWAAFAPESTQPPCDVATIPHHTRDVVRAWSRAALRTHLDPKRASSPADL